MKYWRRISRYFCLLCLLQILATLYLLLKIYFFPVQSPIFIQAKQQNYHIKNEQPFPFFSWKIFDNYYNDIYDKSTQEEVPSHLVEVEDENESSTFSLSQYQPFFETSGQVEIWGTAAIGSYLWEHIFEARKSIDHLNPSIYSSNFTERGITFTYKEGPGLQPGQIHLNSKFLVLVLNGRTEAKVIESQRWLKYVESINPQPITVVIILGNEHCENYWMWSFLKPKGIVAGVFVTYDDPMINDENIFQWPLGVATYRHFPFLSHDILDKTLKKRKYICSIQATTYLNSSRTNLFSVLRSSELSKKFCLIKERKEWLAKETSQSSSNYIQSLLQSDLVLCPSGFNTETYRVFEAMSAGSVPVIEDISSKGKCDSKNGWRLLKRYNPPVIWIRNWNQLDDVLRNERKLSIQMKALRRENLLKWYENFRIKMKDKFVSFLSELINIKN